VYQKKLKYYVFLEDINNIIKVNLLKFKNINVIIDKKPDINQKNITTIIQFCKTHRIPFFLKDNYNQCIKYGSSGIFISSDNRSSIKPTLLKKKFQILGSVHNQLEYSQKIRQSCKLFFLSPLFYNKKYSENNILGIIKFNLITNQWRGKISALGGINYKNIKRVRMLKVYSVGFKNFIKDPETKKPAYNFL
jgi:thiamine-phosphate pyrophosphorylase